MKPTRFFTGVILALYIATLAVSVIAQENQKTPHTVIFHARQDSVTTSGQEGNRVHVEVTGPVVSVTTTGGQEDQMVYLKHGPMEMNGTFQFIEAESGFGEKAVKGAPYSADASTETVRTLADGNRIVHKNTTTVYRDSEGRTRREQTINALGPWRASGEAPKVTFINDPVAGVKYMLRPESRSAVKIVPGPVHHLSSGPSDAVVKHTEIRVTDGPGGAIGIAREARTMQKPQKESLGKQVIEGVEAEGTRTTITIPAGEIGNEQPLNIVTERWYSPELQVTVLLTTNDPMAGQTTYKLTNINRSEPAKSLFEVPADFKIEEPNVTTREMRTRKHKG